MNVFHALYFLWLLSCFLLLSRKSLQKSPINKINYTGSNNTEILPNIIAYSFLKIKCQLSFLMFHSINSLSEIKPHHVARLVIFWILFIF